jgi:GTPase SAR1 family protein
MKIDGNKMFDIKVALMGYVSAGKTTVLNTLLRDKFGEVAMRRATASVNYYCVVATNSSASSSPTQGDWSPAQTATEILQQTIHNNHRLRYAEADDVEEAWFDVELEHALCDNMRDDTRLVVVDIPGINEAGSKSKYKDYVANKWHTFDCVMVVMDGRQGANTDEQVELLRLAKSHCDSIRSVPVIVLCNKIDDPEDEEQAMMVNDVQDVVKTVFQMENPAKSLAEALEKARGCTDRGDVPVPSAFFLPVSAIQAFIYQAGSRLTSEQFKGFDAKLIDKFGKDHFGIRWRRMDDEQKIKNVFDIISEASSCREGLALSNFDKVGLLLSYCIGGNKTQATLQQSKVKYDLAHFSFTSSKELTDTLVALRGRCDAIGLSLLEHLPPLFWPGHARLVADAFSSFQAPIGVALLSDLMDQLLCYAAFAKENGWEREVQTVMKQARMIVYKQASVITNHFDLGKGLECGDSDASSLTVMYGSFLLQANEPFFYHTFGYLKIVLEQRLRAIATNYTKVGFVCCSSYYEYSVDDGELKVKERGDDSFYFFIPPSVRDPRHFGHVVWKFGCLLQLVQGDDRKVGALEAPAGTGGVTSDVAGAHDEVDIMPYTMPSFYLFKATDDDTHGKATAVAPDLVELLPEPQQED